MIGSTSTFGSALMVASKIGIRIECVGIWCGVAYGDCDSLNSSISSATFDSIMSHGDNVRESSSSMCGGLWCIRVTVSTISTSSCSMGEHITTCVWPTVGIAIVDERERKTINRLGYFEKGTRGGKGSRSICYVLNKISA